MRASKHTSAGFTLIEIMMVLAISSLLAVGLLNAYTQNQRRAQFSDAVEGLVSGLEKVRTEVNSSFTASTANTGKDPETVFFGKEIIFRAGNPNVTSEVITSTNVEDPSQAVLTCQNANITTIGLDWGVTIASLPDYNRVVFSRSLVDGSLQAYVMNDIEPCDIANYSLSAFDTSTAHINLTDPNGLSATINVDADSGQITRTYNN